LENNEHRFVDTPTIAAEIRSIEYRSLNMQTSCNIVFD
jgi:hypothetical protein